MGLYAILFSSLVCDGACTVMEVFMIITIYPAYVNNYKKFKSQICINNLMENEIHFGYGRKGEAENV